MNGRNGKLFIFEGIDSVGKTTIIKEICNYLNYKSISFSSYSFPGKEPDTLGELVYDFHHNKKHYINYDINSLSLQMLHVASHIDILKRCIIPDLKKGKIVLLDRSWWSTYAYGTSYGIPKKQLNMILAPELDIVKKLTIEKIFLIERDMQKSEYSQTITNKIINAYNELADKYSKKQNIRKITNDSTVYDATNQILDEMFNC